MIILSERFSFRRDPYCWILSEWKNGFKKDKSPKRSERRTYHATLKQIADEVLNRSAGDCQTMDELKNLFDNASDMLTRKITHVVEKSGE